MTKAYVDSLISNMKHAGIVTKALPWMVEGFGEKELNTRYIGITINNDWQEIMSKNNNLLMKFIIGRKDARIEFYIANKPPFFKFFTCYFSISDKWEIILGELKRRLKKDKLDYINHKEVLGNLYQTIESQLR